MKATEFDAKFDNGEDITDFLDLSQVKHSGDDHQAIRIDFPTWMIEALDQESRRLGVTRQSIIKVWIADRLTHLPR
jgi:hypothetical protein